MSGKTEKKMRRERRKMIQKFIDQNRDIVLMEVMKTMIAAPWWQRILLAFSIIFKVAPKEESADA